MEVCKVTVLRIYNMNLCSLESYNSEEIGITILVYRDERRVSFTLRSLHMPFISLTLGPQPMIHS